MAEKTFSGRSFKTDPMLATEAIMLQMRLLKTLGPAVSRLGTIFRGRGEDASPEDQAAAQGAVMGAFAEVLNQSNPTELAGLLRDVLANARIRRPSGSYDPVDVDGDFTQYKQDIYPVFFWVLKEQFGDFFSGLPGIGSLKKAVGA